MSNQRVKYSYFYIRPPDFSKNLSLVMSTSEVLVLLTIFLLLMNQISCKDEDKRQSYTRTKNIFNKRDVNRNVERFDNGGRVSDNSYHAQYKDTSQRSANQRYQDNDDRSKSSKTPPLSTRTVRTKYGDVSGVIVTLDSKHLEPVEVFRGIPYAMPPVGSLRFMPPVSGALWSGVFIADKFNSVCPQRLPDISNETAILNKIPKGRYEYLKRLLPYLQQQSEDCLYLNIYAPTLAGSRESTGTRFPVIVFIHGESYEWNSGNPYDGSVLASYGGVVVVTINYRLGILGFLNANTDPYLRSPANYGLMDQIAALHWIQENIAAFGGDPTNVTILGHGTGAACVNLLMASSAVPDGMLFHRAILMSGSALSPWALVQNPAKYAHMVARHTNCSPDLPHAHLLKCLRERPLEALLATPIEAPEFAPVFGPSIDGVVIDSEEPTESPDPGPNLRYDTGQYSSVSGQRAGPTVELTEVLPGGINTLNSVLLRKSVVSRLSRYDLLLGVVRAESYFAFNAEDVQYGIEADRRSKILTTFVKENYRYHLNEILATIINEYTDWERPVQHPINIRDETLEALTDAQVVAPVVHTADLHSAARRNSYLYVFDYQTKYSDYPQRQGCIHGEELPYIFGAPLVGGLSHFSKNYTKAEISLSEATMIYWSNFARTGNPNEPQEPDVVHGARQERSRFKNIEWIAYEAVHKKYLNIDTKPKVKNHYRAHRLSFWLNLVPDLHRPGGDDVPRSHHLLDEDDSLHDSLVRLHDQVRGSVQKKKQGVDSTAPGASQGQPASDGKTNDQHPSTSSNGSDILNNIRMIQQPGDTVSDNADNAAASASASATPPQQEDGFAAYSTALSVTIAIGCSLLILNVLIFAGVYYQRDKGRLNHHHHDSGSGSSSASSIKDNKTKIIENGIPNNICGDILLSSDLCKSADPGGGNSFIHHHLHHQLPPPEFSNLPRSATPPNKLKPVPVVLPPVSHYTSTLPRSHSTATTNFNTATLPRGTKNLPSHNLQMSSGGGIMKKTSKTNQTDELRV